MNTKLFLSFMLILLLTSVSVFADGKNKSEQVEDNLLVGVQSENDGLRISSAYYLGEMKSEKAVDFLMKILRDDKNPGARLIAALSLVKIENEQGLFLLKRTALFNSDERVRRMSDKLYHAYLVKKYIEEHPDQAPLFAGLTL